MKTPKPVCLDFETLGIDKRPAYPPAPVGLSVKWPGKKSKYFAWGHAEGNNCSWGDAKKELDKAWAHKDGVLCHHAKFDLDVAETHFGMSALPWGKVHETMFLLFLTDPHQKELGLKPSSERLLGFAPEEQDAVGKWLLDNQPIRDVKISKSKQSDHYFGRYIAFAPGSLVGTYAEGDTDRTSGLFDLLYPEVVERAMVGAYDRERKLQIILLEMERRGLPVNLKQLRQDITLYSSWADQIDLWIIKTLKAPVDINLDSGAQLIGAMLTAGKVDESKMPITPTGKFQTNKEALLLGVADKTLLGMLKYRAQLKTCLNTFMRSWLATAEESAGLIYTTWSQIRSPDGGTRTGRLSSSPNFQNIPNTFSAIFAHDETDEAKSKKLPKCPFKDLPPLPQIRNYITAFDGDVLCGRDFSSQELRVLAHFEDGVLQEAYIENPKMDLHQHAADLITEITSIVISRKEAKTIAFSILYGSGLGKLAEGLGCSVEDAKKLKNAYLGALPGVKDLIADLKLRAKQGIPIRTVGGREYYCEPPQMIDGRLREFSYKMINYMIQASSADQTKDAVIRFYEAKPQARLLLTVHDEILISAPKKAWEKPMQILRESMNAAGLDVPMISDGEVGETWATMKECD
jgi:DNA polymerase-1